MTGGHVFHPTVLREYDIRGTIGQTLGASDAWAVGRALGSDVARSGGREVCVGYDGRLSSPELEDAVVRGLMACGLTVRRIGRGPTPMLYFATKMSGADAGIMVTGSHNPPDQNGFKMLLKSRPYFGEDIRRLGDIAARGDFVDGAGTAIDHPVFDAYVDRLRAAFQDGRARRALTVVWDAGNGAAGEVMQALSQRLPGRHVLLNAAIDGTFPSHHPDPTVPENLEQLRRTVAEEGAELGLAFDGDGDRIGVVDGRGRILWGDHILMLLAEELLQRRPGSTIIADVKTSQVLFDEIARLGGRPEMWRTGHSLMKMRMAELEAPLAGEMSGHIFFADGYYGFDDGLFAAVRVLDVIAGADEALAERYDRMPKMVNTPELRFDCPEDRKFQVIEEVTRRLRDAGADLVDIDGVRVSTDHGWWLLRASNTQAVLVARCEAPTSADLAQLQTALGEQLRLSGLDLPPT